MLRMLGMGRGSGEAGLENVRCKEETVQVCDGNSKDMEG